MQVPTDRPLSSPDQNRVDEFLEKAKQAEMLATTSRDDFMRNSWLSIAESYRDLAAGVRRRGKL
jgi:hypothetical protein